MCGVTAYYRNYSKLIMLKKMICCFCMEMCHSRPCRFRDYSWHGDVIKWKHFLCYWPFVRVIQGHQWIPLTKASNTNFVGFFDLRLNKRLSKQSWGWWFEMPSCSLWRHSNQSGTKPNLVAKILATKFGVFFVIYVMFCLSLARHVHKMTPGHALTDF